jgi:hypothetical protein
VSAANCHSFRKTTLVACKTRPPFSPRNDLLGYRGFWPVVPQTLKSYMIFIGKFGKPTRRAVNLGIWFLQIAPMGVTTPTMDTKLKTWLNLSLMVQMVATWRGLWLTPSSMSLITSQYWTVRVIANPESWWFHIARLPNLSICRLVTMPRFESHNNNFLICFFCLIDY